MQTINISKIFILPTEPDTKVIDRFWYNPTNRILSRYTGSEWEPISVSPDDIDVSVNSQTMSLAEYIDAVTEGLLEVSSQIDSKQDKLQHYSETEKESTVTHILNTNGIHERQLYKNQPQGSYEYKGWYLASKIRVPSMGLVEQESLAWNSWDNIDTYEFQVLLGNIQQEYNIINAIDPTTTYDENSTIANTLAVGDVLTLKNSSNYIDALKITKIEGNRITYKLVKDRLINYSTNLNRLVLLQSYQLNNPVNASIRCNAKPEAGPVVISGGATATNIGGGSNTTRGYLSTTIGGSCNTNSGDFTIVGGEDNIVSGKSSIIFGNENKCNQEINVVLGNQCQANYKNGSLLGYGLVTNHHNQTIIGQFNETMDSTVPYIENSIMLGTGTSDNERYTSIYAKRNQININAENLIWINSNNKVYISGLLTNIGKDNTFDNPGFTVGAGIGLLRSPLDNSNDTTSQVLVGRYNKHVGNGKVSGTPCFVVGNGTRSDRHNAIEVYSGKIDINNDVNINSNKVKINNNVNIDGENLLISNTGLKNLGDYQSSFTKNKIEIAKAYDYKYDENYEQTNEIGKEYVKLTHNSLTLEAEAPGGYNQDKVELNREGLVFTKQEGTQTCVLNPREIRLYNSNYDMFEVNSNGGSDPYHIKLATAYNNSIGDGELEITPTGIQITEATEKDYYGTSSESRTINISYLKDLETCISTNSANVIAIEQDIDDIKQDVNSIKKQIEITTHTSTFTSSSTNITNIYIDASKTAIPGRILIQPNINNVAPIYVGENITDITKAFPLYPDQITDFYFSDINNFKIACDAIGDGCNFVIEWGVTNVVADIASAFTMYDDNGNKFKIKIANGGLVAEQLN